MDKLARYRELIKNHLGRIEELCNRSPTPGVETLRVFDEERDCYLLVSTGWFQKERMRGTTLFVRLKDGKIWIEEDWTEDGIAAELLGAGVPREDLVPAFQAPETRHLTEFAVA